MKASTSSPSVDPVTLSLYRHRFESIAEEMGLVVKRSALSPNIKERLDFSCAVFDDSGACVAQAAHIPVHLGAMPASVRAVRDRFDDFRPGDVIILNDPFSGGTHLPDLTMVSPVFLDGAPRPSFFVASRAHHADVGGMSPGSLPLSMETYQEGFVFPPVRIMDGGAPNEALIETFLRNVRIPDERKGDLHAQFAAQSTGCRRIQELVHRFGREDVLRHAVGLIDYAERMTEQFLKGWNPGTWRAHDQIHLDPIGDSVASVLDLYVSAHVEAGNVTFDFSGTSPQGEHPYNAVLPITEAACLYAVRLLIPEDIPINDGCARKITVHAPPGTVVHAMAPAAVAAGNVETSQRIVDVVLAALARAVPWRVPAASQGTMNNVLMGGESPRPFVYYETIGGGGGAHPGGTGLSGRQVHMTNTLNTPVEALESAYPLRMVRYAIREGSAGSGLHAGGDGVIREYAFLAPTRVTVLSSRRHEGPPGLCGGTPGLPGRNLKIDLAGDEIRLPGQFAHTFQPGERLRIETPGGGGWGTPSKPDSPDSGK